MKTANMIKMIGVTMRMKKSGDNYIDLAIDILRSSKHLSPDERESLLDLERIQKSKKRISKINSIFRNT